MPVDQLEIPDDQINQGDKLNAGTPSPSSIGSPACDEAAFESFSGHLFYGPTVGNPTLRTLHELRELNVHGTGPVQFQSGNEPVNVPSDGLYNVENASGEWIEVVFLSETLGIGTEIASDKDTGITKVKVANIEPTSPANFARVNVGDYVIAVNGEAIQPKMTEAKILELIQNASTPKKLLFLHLVEHVSPLQAGAKKSMEKISNGAKAASKLSIFNRLPLSKLQTAKEKMGTAMGNALGFRNQKVHANTTCSGCQMSPITGSLWSCSSCADVDLCGNCYGAGVHGFEADDRMRTFDELTIQYELKKQCSKFTDEFLLALRRDICKERLDKFEYMGSWLADVVGGTPASKITVRGLEIPNLSPEIRQNFVGMFMPFATDRTDIELHVEWLVDDEDKKLEKLRIWLSDKKSRTTCPFK